MDDRLQSAANLLRPLADAAPGVRFWLVGGSVRDFFLHRDSFDYDIAVDGNPADFAASAAGRLGGRPVPIGPPGKRIHRLAAGPGVFDFAGIEGSGIEEDLQRRDFTVNAMAFDPVKKEVIDPLGGRKDLESGRIRMVSEQVFVKDPVRLVRAFRISATVGLELESETASCIRRHAGWIENSAGERVRDELYKLLAVEWSERTVRHMSRCNLLESIFPEVAGLKGCRQNTHHQYDVFDHTLMVLSRLESLLTDPPQRLLRTPALEDLRRTPVPLKMAALLHDIGKPAARGQTADGRVHFRGHPRIGQRAALAVFERLRLPNRHRGVVGHLIRHHVEPLQLFIAHQRSGLTRKGRTRFFLRNGSTTPALLLLALADMAGKRTPPDSRFGAFAAFIDDLLVAYLDDFCPRDAHPPLIGGRDLIEELGLAPSPAVGKILSRIEAERLEGRLKTRDEALKRARALAAAHRKD